MMWAVVSLALVSFVTVSTGFPFDCSDVGCSWCGAPRIIEDCAGHCQKKCQAGGSGDSGTGATKKAVKSTDKPGQKTEKPTKATKGPKTDKPTQRPTEATKTSAEKTTKAIETTTTSKDFDHGPVPLPEANKRFHACCEKEFTAPEEKNCIPLCKYDITNAEFQGAILANTCPTKYLPRSLKCANAGNDNTDCCTAKKVLEGRPQCGGFCNKEASLGVLGQQHFACSPFLNTIMKCHQNALKSEDKSENSDNSESSNKANKQQSDHVETKKTKSSSTSLSDGKKKIAGSEANKNSAEKKKNTKKQSGEKKSSSESDKKKLEEKKSKNDNKHSSSETTKKQSGDKSTSAPNYDSPVVPLSDANKRFHQCCEDKFSGPDSKGCVELCKYDVDLGAFQTAVLSKKCGVDNVPEYLKCANDGHDNSACCTTKKVSDGRPQCSEFCTKEVNLGKLGNQHIACMPAFTNVMKCHHSGLKP